MFHLQISYVLRSIIHSDEWQAYFQLLNNAAYTHLTVNHSIHFVDPTTGVHTQIIENTWMHVKHNQKTNKVVFHDPYSIHTYKNLCDVKNLVINHLQILFCKSLLCILFCNIFSINLLPSFVTPILLFSDDDMTRSLITPIEFFPVPYVRTMEGVHQLHLLQIVHYEIGMIID